jgi:hypothetical protein
MVTWDGFGAADGEEVAADEDATAGMLGTVRTGPSAAGAARTVAARARIGRKAIILTRF